jgi:hypothetical protein
MQKYLGILVLIVTFAVVESSAQVATSAVPFLLITPTSRGGGMGETGAAIADDAWAQYWNPGGLAFQNNSELAISQATWLPQFQLGDMWIAHLAFKLPVEEIGGMTSFGLTYLNLGQFNKTGSGGPEILGTFNSYEVAATAGYATKITDELGLGMNLRFIYSALAPFGTEQERGTGIGSAVSFDVGLLYKISSISIPFADTELKNFMNIGMNLSNIGPSITYIDEAQADPLPMNLRLGFAFNVYEDDHNLMTIAVDFNKLLVYTPDSTANNPLPKGDPFYKSIITTWTGPKLDKALASINDCVGFEYWYDKMVALRMGYFYEDPNAGNRRYYTFGAGLRYQAYGIDFSYISTVEENHPLANTLRFTLLMEF